MAQDAAPPRHQICSGAPLPSAREAIDGSIARLAVRSTDTVAAGAPLSQRDLVNLMVLLSLRPPARNNPS
jgi:hypothetical protein